MTLHFGSPNHPLNHGRRRTIPEPISLAQCRQSPSGGGIRSPTSQGAIGSRERYGNFGGRFT